MHVGKETLKREKICNEPVTVWQPGLCHRRNRDGCFPVLRQFFWMQFTTASNFFMMLPSIFSDSAALPSFQRTASPLDIPR